MYQKKTFEEIGGGGYYYVSNISCVNIKIVYLEFFLKGGMVVCLAC